MKGSENDCRLFTTEISILDYDAEEAVFKTCFQPRAIDTEKWGTFYSCLRKPWQGSGNLGKVKETTSNSPLKSTVQGEALLVRGPL